MPRFTALPATVAALTSLSGCASGPAVTPRDVAVLGSSTTAGTGAASTATSCPAHDLDAALALHPALVFIQFPSNDAPQRYPLEETLANHVVLRDGVRAAGAVEVIVGPFPRAIPAADQVALMTGLRDALPTVGAPRYLPLWADLAMTDNQVLAKYAFGDGIHLNDAGHALIAQKVLASDAWKAVCSSK